MPEPRRLNVLRLGRLGDIVMVEPALRWLGSAPELDITLVTDARLAAVFDRLLPGVRVVGPGAIPEADLVLDLHRVAASRRLRRGSPWIGVRKEDLRRRVRVHAPVLPLRPLLSWPQRHLEAANRAMQRLGLEPGPPPAPIPRLSPSRPPEPGLVGISPGAGHATKRWPVERWRQFLAACPGRVVGFGSAAERPLLDAIGVERWPDDSLDGLVDGLSACSVLVAGDTGPMHVAGALGRRVVALYGPTPTDTGFWVWGSQGDALRAGSIGCSPCSMHGGARCPKVHHGCMVDLAVEAVVEAAACA